MNDVIVVDSGNIVIGCIVNGLFYDKYFIDVSSLSSTSKVYGIYTKTGILTNLGIFPYASFELNITNCFTILYSLKEYLVDIVFIPCSSKDLDTEQLSSIWGSNILEHLNCYLYICISTKNMKEVAYLMLKQDLYSDDILHINMLECIVKDCGYGTAIINQLKLLNKSIKGLSTYNARAFWYSQGAVFKDSSLYFSI